MSTDSPLCPPTTSLGEGCIVTALFQLVSFILCKFYYYIWKFMQVLRQKQHFFHYKWQWIWKKILRTKQVKIHKICRKKILKLQNNHTCNYAYNQEKLSPCIMLKAGISFNCMPLKEGIQSLPWPGPSDYLSSRKIEKIISWWARVTDCDRSSW